MILVKPCSTKFTLCHCSLAYVIILLYCEETDMKCVMKVLMDYLMCNQDTEIMM